MTTDVVVASTPKKITGAALAPGVIGRVEWQTEKDDLFSASDVLSLVDVQGMFPIHEVVIGDETFTSKEQWEQKPIQRGQRVAASLKNTSGRFAPGQVIFWVSQTNGEVVPVTATIEAHGEPVEVEEKTAKVSTANALRQGNSTDVVIHLTRRHAEVAARVLRYPSSHGIMPHELQIVAQAVATAVSYTDAKPKATFRQASAHRRGTR